MFSKNLILLFIDKVTTAHNYIWNVALVVVVAGPGLGPTSAAVLGIIQFLDHDKSCSFSQLIKGKSRDLQK